METTQNAIQVTTDWLAWANVGIQLAESLAWPIIVGVLVGCTFRKQIADFIGRVVKVGKEGVEATATTQIDTATVPSTETQLEHVLAELDPLIAEKMEELRRTLDGTDFQTPEARETILLTALAHSNVAAFFEAIFSQIFGSQIKLLEYLNTVEKSTVDTIKFYYSNAAQSWPAFYANYTIDQWLAFLQNFGLINRADDEVAITGWGQALLKYIIHRRYNSAAKLG